MQKNWRKDNKISINYKKDLFESNNKDLKVKINP